MSMMNAHKSSNKEKNEEILCQILSRYNIVIVDDIAEYTGAKFEEPIPRGLAKSSSHKRSY